MSANLILRPSPPAPKPEPCQLIQEPKPQRKCFGLPRLNSAKCSRCRDFDLCYHHHLSTVKQGRIKLL